MQQRNALNVIYSPLRSTTTRRLSLHFSVPARWRFLAALQAHPRPTLQRPPNGTDERTTPPYAISIPHSNLFAANGYINGRRWPVTCQTCVDVRCSCSWRAHTSCIVAIMAWVYRLPMISAPRPDMQMRVICFGRLSICLFTGRKYIVCACLKMPLRNSILPLTIFYIN